MGSFYANITDDTLIARDAGKLKGIFVASISGSPTIKVYDGVDATGPVLLNTFTPVAAKFYRMPKDALEFTRGLYVEIGNTLDCTLFFEGNAVKVLTPPVADFSGTPVSGAAPLSVVFTDSSTNTPTSWLWEKNSGAGWVNFAGTPTDQNPTESFAAGTWSVRLTATNAGGSDPETKTDYITAT